MVPASLYLLYRGQPTYKSTKVHHDKQLLGIKRGRLTLRPAQRTSRTSSRLARSFSRSISGQLLIWLLLRYKMRSFAHFSNPVCKARGAAAELSRVGYGQRTCTPGLPGLGVCDQANSSTSTCVR